MPTDTPMMQQYKRAKSAHPDAIVLFRMGDFYEAFYEDAHLASRVLGLTLTSRDRSSPDPVPMAGVPHHSVDGYVARLLAAGHRVAICEQMDEPGAARGIMERKVVEVISPGTVTSGALLPERDSRYLAALARGPQSIGIAACDVSTGELILGEVSPSDLEATLARFPIAEVLVPEGADPWPRSEPSETASGPLRTTRPMRDFDVRRGRERLLEHFGVLALDAFDCETLTEGLGAGGALLAYLSEMQGERTRAVAGLARLRTDDVMVIDPAALGTLEVLESGEGTRSGSLLALLDHTRTAMGARTLRRALRAPLRDVARICARQDAVEFLRAAPELRARLGETFRGMGDLERLVARVVAERATPRELGTLRDALVRLQNVREILSEQMSAGAPPVLLAQAAAALPDASGLQEHLSAALVDDPPLSPTAGGIIRRGYNATLDEIHAGAREGKTWIARLQETERARTGIGTLKVGYNRVFGYYIEVSRGQAGRVPDTYQRRQSLTGAERFVTPELKEVESRVLGAEERGARLEQELFVALRSAVAGEASPLRAAAVALAWLDVFVTLAEVAEAREYVRPDVDEGEIIEIEDGRHPVVEAALPAGAFVPNNAVLGASDRRLSLVTGPNMAGKSTFLRQVGLITLLAQVGACVPVRRARIGVADRIFTRVGAADQIARGRSTFLVEMIETATVLRNATSKSLVLLDEIGRGTSTYDGLAIAWAVTEHLLSAPHGSPRTLFATHYHELTHLAGRLPGLCTLNVLVKEWGDRIVFLRRIVDGAADRSYGIHVAQLAGLPEAVVARARAILHHLEDGVSAESVPLAGQDRFPVNGDVFDASARDDSCMPQIDLFGSSTRAPSHGASDALLEEIRRRLDALDPNRLTPLEALSRLAELRERYGSGD
jgi:DNA mismatch repair protein MutS